MKPKQNPVADSLPLSLDLVKRRIYIVRGQEVVLASDLAELYQVPTKTLNLAVKRNSERFPADFVFQLTKEEHSNLILQFATSSLRFQSETSKIGRGGRRYLPYAFTEHGVAMLSSVLKSKRAIQMNIFIIRAFIELRKMLVSHEQISRRLQKVEGKINLYGQVLTGVVADIKRIKNPPLTKAIGFEYRPKSKQ